MSCLNSITVPGGVDAVWSRIRDFHELSWAKGVVEKVEKVGACAGDQVGARRVINGLFQETLIALDDRAHGLRYSIDDAPGTPVAKDRVSSYVGEVKLFPITATGETFVYWTSSWESGSAEIAPFCNPIYAALLGALRASFQR